MPLRLISREARRIVRHTCGYHFNASGVSHWTAYSTASLKITAIQLVSKQPIQENISSTMRAVPGIWAYKTHKIWSA